MSDNDTYTIVKRGGSFSHHVLENTKTGKKLFLCGCGGTKNADGTCDGTHNKKRESGCRCEFCKPPVESSIA